MATYNTAFGSLPSTQDLTGQNNTTAGGAQQRPRRRPRPEEAQGQTQTFADMQKAGQARPAPPTGPRPAQQALDNTQSDNLLGDLRSRLSESQPAMDPQVQAQKAYAQANPATVASTPVQDVQRMTDMQQKQQQVAAPSPQTAQATAQSALDRYRAVQEPSYVESIEQQSAQADDLRQKQDAMASPAEEDASMNERLAAVLGQTDTAPVETQAAQPASDFLSQVSNVVAPAAAAPAAAAATTAPAAASATTAPAPSPAAAPAAATTAAAPATAPAAPAAPAAAATTAAAPTAAAPTTATTAGGASYERFGGSGLANTLMSQLQQQLQQMQSAPSRFEDPAYKASRDAALANMDAEAQAQRSKLEEEMAARGLAASSISSGRYGDLAGQQARARATMEADLLKEQAQTSAQDRQLLLSSMGDLAKTAGAQSLGEFNANIESMKASGQLDLAAKELMQKERLEGRSMDLQQARDAVAAELGRGDLSFKYSSLAQEKGIEEGRLAETRALRLQNLGISNQELELKTAELMGADKTGRLTRQAAADQAELQIKTRQLMQTDRSLSITEAQNLAQNEIDKQRIASQETIESNRLRETTRANQAQEAQATLDYKLRQTLGMDAQKLDERRTKVTENQFLMDLNKIIADGNLSPAETDALYGRYGITPPTRTSAPVTTPVITNSYSNVGGGGGTIYDDNTL